MDPTESEEIEEVEEFVDTKNISLHQFINENRLDEFSQVTNPNTPEVNDLIALYNKPDKSDFHDNLFTYLCVLSGESLTTQPLDQVELYVNYDLQFQHHYNHCLIQQYHRDALVTPLNLTDWPSSFVIFIRKKKESEPPRSFMKKLKLDSEAITSQKLKEIYFGYTVYNNFLNAKERINNFLNPEWIPPGKYPSGTTKSSFLRSMRKTYYLNVTIPRELVTNPAIDNEHPNEVRDTHGFHDSYYPSHWMSFLYLGIPSEDPLNCLTGNSGMISNPPEEIDNVISLRDRFRKPNRRMIDQVTSSSSSPAASSSSSITSCTTKKSKFHHHQSSPEHIYSIKHYHVLIPSNEIHNRIQLENNLKTNFEFADKILLEEITKAEERYNNCSNEEKRKEFKLKIDELKDERSELRMKFVQKFEDSLSS